MAFKTPDRVQETAIGTGTGALTLAGASPRNFRPLSAALSNNDTFFGVVSHQSETEWQSGLYRYNAGTITLVDLHASSTGAQIAFSAGTKDVIVGPVGRTDSWILRDADCNALAGDHLDCDTSAGPFTVTLPAAPSEGDRFPFNDSAASWATDNLTIDPNGKTFEDGADSLRCDVSALFCIVYRGGQYRVR